MGVRRLFSRGGQKFSRGGQEPTFCLKSNEKYTIFHQKSLKNILFLAGQRGQEPPLPIPADAHVYKQHSLSQKVEIKNSDFSFELPFPLLLFPPLLPSSLCSSKSITALSECWLDWLIFFHLQIYSLTFAFIEMLCSNFVELIVTLQVVNHKNFDFPVHRYKPKCYQNKTILVSYKEFVYHANTDRESVLVSGIKY